MSPFNAEDAEGNGEDAENRVKRTRQEQQLRAERDSFPRSERGFKGARR